MKKRFSCDFKNTALKMLNKGMTQLQVAEILNVSPRSLYNWKQRFLQCGNVSAKSGYQKGHSHKITDLVAFKQFVQENAGLTLEQLAAKWGNISDTTIGRALKKINGCSFQKRHPFNKVASDPQSYFSKKWHRSSIRQSDQCSSNQE